MTGGDCPVAFPDRSRELGADFVISLNGPTHAERVQAVRDLTQGRGGDVIVGCTGVADAIPEGLEMARRGGAYFVAGVFADVGDIPINPQGWRTRSASSA